MTTPRKSKTPAYEADRYYDLKVAKVVTHRGTHLRPKGHYRVKGTVLNDLPAEAIASAEPVAVATE